MTDYKKYSLENLENWLYDAMSCGDATPQEIYDTIIKVVKDEYYTYKKRASESYELLSLLNGFGKSQYDTSFIDTSDILRDKEYYEPSMPPWGHSDLEYLSCYRDDKSPECQKSWNDFWEDNSSPEEVNKKEDKVNRWVLPVQVDGLTGECYINLPDDLLERAGLQEGSMVHFIDRGDGSFEMRKVNAK